MVNGDQELRVGAVDGVRESVKGVLTFNIRLLYRIVNKINNNNNGHNANTRILVIYHLPDRRQNGFAIVDHINAATT